MKKVFSVLLLISSFSASASPSEVSNYLMNEPASMMDYGIFQLVNSLKEGYGINATIEYDWDKDRIIVSKNSDSIESMDTKQQNYLKERNSACRKEIMKFKNILTIVLAPSFNHIGFERKSIPKDFGDNLAKLVTIKITGFVQDDANNNGKIPEYLEKQGYAPLYLGTHKEFCVLNLSDENILFSD